MELIAAVRTKFYLFKVNDKKTLEKVWNMFKVKNKNARTTSVAFSGVCIVNFEHIEHSVSIADFQEVNLSQECSHHIEIRPLIYNADQLIGFYL